MNKKTQEKLEEIIKNYDQVTTEIVEAITSELKNNCKTFGELETQLLRFGSFANWSLDRTKAHSLFIILESHIQTEKNNLPLTTCVGEP